MAGKFFGAIGFGHTEEAAADVFRDVVVEKNYFGDVLANTRTLQEGEKVNSDLSVGNRISIVADAYATAAIADGNFFAMRYIMWLGVRWSIQKVDVLHPRLVLTLGGVYNGPIPASVEPDPEEPSP